MRYLQLATLLLMTATWSTAQTSTPANNHTPTQAPANDPSASPTTSMSSAAANGGSSDQGQMAETSAGGDYIEGCLSGADGNYTLSDKNGVSYRLTGDTAKLSEHIGHEVKISGTKSTAAATSSGDTMGQTGGAQQAIQVSGVKHVAKSCTAASPGTK